MSGKTKIEWAERVWNPVVGCTKVSEGCRYCYAEALHERRHKAYLAGAKLPAQYAEPFETVQLHADRLSDPLKWRKPCRVFVNSMSDLFHSAVSWQFLAEVFAVMAACPDHTFMILTKRADRLSILVDAEFIGDVDYTFHGLTDSAPTREARRWISNQQYWGPRQRWPLPNVWLGVSVEDQKAADERIPYLLQTPAAVRFVSCEPLLGPVDLTRIKWAKIPINPKNYQRLGVPVPDEMWSLNNALTARPADEYNAAKIGLDWVICGGESGTNARPMHPDWARGLRDQCAEADVPFFFKQWGEFSPTGEYRDGKVFMHRVGKKAAGRMLDGRAWNEFPRDGTARFAA